MNFLSLALAAFVSTAAFADDSFLSNVSLRTDGSAPNATLQCLLDETLRQAFPAYELSRISHASIDKAGLPEEENARATVYFLAADRDSGKLAKVALTLSAFDDEGKWTYLQEGSSVYPFSKKVHELATAGMSAEEAPFYVLLGACK